jgi:predicted deacylase
LRHVPRKFALCELFDRRLLNFFPAMRRIRGTIHMVPAAVVHSFAHRADRNPTSGRLRTSDSPRHIAWLRLDAVLSPDRGRSRWDIPSTSSEGGDAPNAL